MIKYIFALLMVFLVQGPCLAGGDPGLFSYGFRQIPWGTHKNDLPDLNLSKKALKSIYKTGDSSVFFMEGKGNLEMKFQAIPLVSLFLKFHNALFTGVDMVFSKTDFPKVASTLKEELGTPLVSTDSHLEWQTGYATVVLTDREIMVTSSH